MKTVVTLPELRAARLELAAPVGLAPTMGYLHAGHLSLVRQARRECASVVVSIFVNPTQFGPHEDPRDLARDLDLLRREDADLVWTPTLEIVYPPDFQSWVTVGQVAQPLEGSMRPGHFRGVATVVAKLFNVVQPHRAYFGQKDAQQAAVIRQMVKDLNFNLELVVCPTQREPDGLALSSRNVYLNPEERRAATALWRALSAAQKAYQQGQSQAERLREAMRAVLQAEPLANVEYVSCADPDTMQEIEGRLEGRQALLSMAVKIGKTRLIDNLLIGG